MSKFNVFRIEVSSLTRCARLVIVEVIGDVEMLEEDDSLVRVNGLKILRKKKKNIIRKRK